MAKRLQALREGEKVGVQPSGTPPVPEYIEHNVETVGYTGIANVWVGGWGVIRHPENIGADAAVLSLQGSARDAERPVESVGRYTRAALAKAHAALKLPPERLTLASPIDDPDLSSCSAQAGTNLQAWLDAGAVVDAIETVAKHLAATPERLFVVHCHSGRARSPRTVALGKALHDARQLDDTPDRETCTEIVRDTVSTIRNAVRAPPPTARHLGLPGPLQRRVERRTFAYFEDGARDDLLPVMGAWVAKHVRPAQ